MFVEDSPYVGRVSMDDTFTLAITQTTLQDARVFVCQVGAGSLGVGENRTELRVYSEWLWGRLEGGELRGASRGFGFPFPSTHHYRARALFQRPRSLLKSMRMKPVSLWALERAKR